MYGSSDLNAKTSVCAVLFIPIAAGPLLLELLLDRFAEATLNSPAPFENSEIVVRQSHLKVVSGMSLLLVSLITQEARL